ncbi:MAG: ABC transporter permease [Paracoccaceae bacterium]
MFYSTAPKTKLGASYRTLELIYHTAVRNVRKTHNNAIFAIATNITQMIFMVLAFYFMFSILGLRGFAVRGDFLVYIMSGIFLYMTHLKAVGAVMGSEGPTSPMMQHAPLNTAISIAGSIVSALYIQVMSLVVILFVYHVAITPLDIDKPAGAFGMLMLAFFTGLGVGMILLALKPWFPGFVSIFMLVYQRANMIASGKMFLANTLPTYMLVMFDWNPLFHCIDQARGFAFVNYFPRNSDWHYALWLGLALLMIGLMGEFYTRKHSSLSWSARR